MIRRILCIAALSVGSASLMLQSCSNNTVTSFRGGSNARGGLDQQTGGTGGGTPGAPGTPGVPGKPGTPLPQQPTVNLVEKNLIWKRYRALEQSLMAGLSLSKDQLCKEAGNLSCVDQVHLFALGGNEPFNKAQYNRLEAPSVTTGVAVDRLVLAACSARLRLDKGSNPRVFTKLALDGSTPTPAAVKEQATVLYQQLLLRNPTSEELAILSGFGGGLTSEKTAKSLCFAIASHAEFLFI